MRDRVTMMNKTPTSSLSRQDIDHLLAQSYPDGEPIAVIGYACRFGQASDSQAFWHSLVEGQELSCRFSRQQLLDAGIPARIIDDPGYVNVGVN
ncbi:beta-ketoacyl synthase N-terminal-like domain-containing protein [Vibrio sp. PP-XX7]